MNTRRTAGANIFNKKLIVGLFTTSNMKIFAST
ncbi:hypothetical protein BJV40_000703 [Clostridium beijerinckii]|nr:hypothetical protein [Clostridium beijerinckii]